MLEKDEEPEPSLARDFGTRAGRGLLISSRLTLNDQEKTHKMRREYPETVKAIWRKDLAALERLARDPAHRDELDPDGRTPLMAAAIDSNLPAVKILLSARAEVNLQDPSGWSALHFAAQENALEVCGALLDAGARHDLRNSHGDTPLFLAVFNSRGSGALITLLRSRGADPLATNNRGVSPCALARRIANYNVAQFFADMQEKEALSQSLDAGGAGAGLHISLRD